MPNEGNVAVNPSDIDTSPREETTEVKPETTEKAPEPEAKPEATPEAKPETPAATEKLYKLPDGREVTAEQLHDLHVNKLLPDYTRKSQELARLTRPPDQNIKKEEPAWQKPDYQPASWAEVIKLAEEQAISRLASEAQAEEDRVRAITQEVDSQVAELKSKDAKLDENALFAHANKYGFADLRTAYQNMQDTRKAVLDTEQRVLKNIRTRDADPVGNPNGAVAPGDGYDPAHNSQYANAVDYLRGKFSRT